MVVRGKEQENGIQFKFGVKHSKCPPILTEQEVQMAVPQLLKATHAVYDTGRVNGVADIVDNRVAGVSDQVSRLLRQGNGRIYASGIHNLP